MQTYFGKAPAKVFNLRPDSLAILTHAANVGPYARVCCVDATGGILASACVERMGGFGSLCCVHAEVKRYFMDAVRQLNAGRQVARSARHCTLEELMLTHKEVTLADAAAAAAAATAADAAAAAADAAAATAADAAAAAQPAASTGAILDALRSE